jgi:pimeloyl-ACP methyl ester carboxylesterase
MIRSARRLSVPMAVLAALWGGLGVGAASDAALTVDPLSPGFVIDECPQEGVEARVECGHIRVLENRETGRGREIEIHFVRARAVGPDRVPDPLFVLVGGPGEHASRSTAARLRARGHFLQRRDVVVVDQRGTGRSNPLDCEEYDLVADPSGFRRLFDVDFFDAETMRRCRGELESRADLTQYTASAIADDIDQVRAALGYERINLDGGSWGTRLGLEFIRRHGDRVRSAILAGVAPTTAILVETVARDFQDALDALIRDCRADAQCAAAFPDFEPQLEKVLERVAREPVTLELVNPGTGEPEPVRLRHAQLLTAIRFSLYSTRLSAALPLQVKAAAGGDLAPISALLPQLLYELKNAVSEGMWASVKCAEELPFVDLERARSAAKGTLMGTLRLDQERAICGLWPRGRVPEDYHDPVVSNVPVLLLTAELDPTSPARLGAQAAEHLAHGTLVEVANRSHWGLGGNECIEGIVTGFLEAGSGAGLDTSCAGEFERPPFRLPA